MDSFATPEFMGETAAKRVKLQLEGVAPKVGSFPCILGPRVVGTFAHEVLGHLSEADLNVHTPFNGKVGSVVAAEGVNMVDDGTNLGQVGVAKYDDEGVPTSRVEIIKDSILTELMNNREYASKIGQRATGNARAQSYLFPPAIRMRNTIIEPGDFQEEELFEGIDFGYYCVDFRGGSAQMNASFQVGIQEGFEIVNGEIGQPVADLSISGIGTDSLYKIDAISKKELQYGAGRCGKFAQWAYVSNGGTDIRFSKGGITFGGKS
jgi:TldD protein